MHGLKMGLCEVLKVKSPECYSCLTSGLLRNHTCETWEAKAREIQFGFCFSVSAEEKC
jgi:hypothetical protein